MKQVKTLGLLVAALGFTSIAQANEVEVDFYGRIQLSTAYLYDGDEGGLNVASNASRIGVTADYRLNEDLSVFAEIERSVDVSEGGSSLGARDTLIGFKGDFGTVTFGYFGSPTKSILSGVEEFRDRIGDGRNMLRRGEMHLDRRYKNAVQYQTPNMNGFVWKLHYGTEEQTGVTVTNDNDIIGTSLQYRTGGWAFTAGYQHDNRNVGKTVKGTRFSVVRIGDGWRVAALGQRVTNLVEGDATGWILSGRYRLNNEYWLKAQVGARSYDDIDNNESSSFSIGLDRVLSPSLTVYTVATMTNNDDLGLASITEGGFGKSLPVMAGNDPFGLSAGVVFRF
ncbi:MULTISPECIES: porin [Gammaproteobacteria]|uniref:porin n=1 Tax=Gammaproteobacteria TaxID=1236 RepID=UPI000DCFB5FA|nr:MULTISPECIES: porin [Gammaproteobacteria]RTE85543.1 porin [Aliidiomarina sp. B3213]TCZ89513.1 porin [Lysobacter sp. N42]